jgi:hypothetical protein
MIIIEIVDYSIFILFRRKEIKIEKSYSLNPLIKYYTKHKELIIHNLRMDTKIAKCKGFCSDCSNYKQMNCEYCVDCELMNAQSILKRIKIYGDDFTIQMAQKYVKRVQRRKLKYDIIETKLNLSIAMMDLESSKQEYEKLLQRNDEDIIEAYQNYSMCSLMVTKTSKRLGELTHKLLELK